MSGKILIMKYFQKKILVKHSKKTKFFENIIFEICINNLRGVFSLDAIISKMLSHKIAKHFLIALKTEFGKKIHKMISKSSQKLLDDHQNSKDFSISNRL